MICAVIIGIIAVGVAVGAAVNPPEPDPDSFSASPNAEECKELIRQALDIAVSEAESGELLDIAVSEVKSGEHAAPNTQAVENRARMKSLGCASVPQASVYGDSFGQEIRDRENRIEAAVADGCKDLMLQTLDVSISEAGSGRDPASSSQVIDNRAVMDALGCDSNEYVLQDASFLQEMDEKSGRLSALLPALGP